MKFYLDVKDLSPDQIRASILEEPHIRFVSLAGVDMGNNHTDEKIPVREFLDDMEGFLEKGIQTDGSSVVLPKIAMPYDARVDLIPDCQVRWYIDYSKCHRMHNPTLEDEWIGTLVIPSFIYHDGKEVGSRGVLKRAGQEVERQIKAFFQAHPETFRSMGIESLAEIHVNLATELEFWVESLHVTKDEETLFISQELKEQYWKRPSGELRKAMEECLMLMETYDLRPEMAHKEVGGVGSRLEGENAYSHMEQIEIDWSYNDALQALDNEFIIKNMVLDVFNRHGLDVTFKAKPIEGVAGSGEHHHFSFTLIDKKGKKHNLFAPAHPEKDYLSPLGYGALMGLMKHYNLITPFISSNLDALNRLKPGFEAPVSTVFSMGKTVTNPTRNRSVLLCVIRDLHAPQSYRFELRSPNPGSNSYLLAAATLLAMTDGMAYAIDKEPSDLLEELNKKAGDPGTYLRKDRQYRDEDDIYSLYTEAERNERFGPCPQTVYDIYLLFREEDAALLTRAEVFTDRIIESYLAYMLDYWLLEVRGRLIPEESQILRSLCPLHQDELEAGLDEAIWNQIQKERLLLMKDTPSRKSLMTELSEACLDKDPVLVSRLQYDLQQRVSSLKHAYVGYRHNIINL